VMSMLMLCGYAQESVLWVIFVFSLVSVDISTMERVRFCV